ncbi:MAG: alpha/beta hydrolase [Dongiaceae bacterium]
MILDWDDAYANASHIEGGELYPAKWAALAKAFRAEVLAAGRAELDLPYGAAERETLDLFRPSGRVEGLAIFAHGGYWMAFDKSSWSHLAAGALERGWAVGIPSYTLAPRARISEISRQFARAVRFAADRVDGPLRLAGHSAGGHLVTRMVCEDSPLPNSVGGRIGHVVSISGLHDLRPLLRTQMNATLRLDAAEASAESPALNRPTEQCSVTCWVGSNERPEFVRQSELLANTWTGLGAAMRCVHADGRHHFDVIEDLADPTSKLTEAFVGHPMQGIRG